MRMACRGQARGFIFNIYACAQLGIFGTYVQGIRYSTLQGAMMVIILMEGRV
jgi:hypothetical protein